MYAAVDLGILGLAGVLFAVHFVGEFEFELDGRDITTVEAILGAIGRTGDGTAGLPPGHLGRGITALRLADQLAAFACFEDSGIRTDSNRLRQDYEDK